jgi:hypothetical protein
MASLHHSHEFNLCSDMFLSYLEVKGDFSKIMRQEHFAEGNKGWARSVMPKGSASINNYLEAFDVSVLSRDFVCGTRTTMSQFFQP